MCHYALQQVERDCRDDNGLAANLTNRRFSIDSSVDSVTSEEEAVEVYKSLQKSSANSGFQLTKWTCNSKKVMDEIIPEDGLVALSRTFKAEALAPSLFALQLS